MKKSQSKVPNEADIYVGTKLKASRMERKLSQRQLADKIKITFQQIQKYEKGINRISIGTLYDICTALGISPSQFLKDFDNKFKVAEDKYTLIVKEIGDLVAQLTLADQKKILHLAQKLIKIKGTKNGG